MYRHIYQFAKYSLKNGMFESQNVVQDPVANFSLSGFAIRNWILNLFGISPLDFGQLTNFLLFHFSVSICPDSIDQLNYFFFHRGCVLKWKMLRTVASFV